MRILVESGACVSSLNTENQNVLHIVCKTRRFNDYAMIRYLLNKGVSPYGCDKDNMTPFLYAIGDQDRELAEAFLRDGFDLRNQVLRRAWPGRTTISNFVPMHQQEEPPVDTESRLTALHFSAMNACTDMTAFLLQWEADPNARSDFGDTPLHLAIRCQLLGRRYDDIWMTGQYSIESLKEIITDHAGPEGAHIYQTIDNARVQIVETLLESKSINVNMANCQGDYPQHVINFHQYYALSILDKLVEKGADISQPNRARRTCFHLASKAGNLEVVRRFVNEGHDILLQDAEGLSPFHYAVSRGCLDILHFMSENCNNVLSEAWHSLDHLGKSPLHHHVSSVFCSAEVVRFLIQLGCDVNQSDREGNSPLGLYLKSFHLAVQGDIFCLLFRGSADMLWVDKNGQNLAHLLMHHRKPDEMIFDILFQNGLDPAATDLDGRTLMHHGAIHGVFTKELVKLLESRGALRLHTKDLIGKTPLDYAEEEADQDFPEYVFEEHLLREESYESLKAMSHILL